MIKYLLFTIILILAIWASYHTGVLPIVLSADTENETVHFAEKQDQLLPLSEIDFTNGENTAYLVLSSQDIAELPDGIPRHKVLVCTQNAILENLKKSLVFRPTHGDMATCESRLLVYHEHKLVLSTAIVIGKTTTGIQSSHSGWLEATDPAGLVSVFGAFEPVYFPIIGL
jgi:hypothetical protein